jgi:hypothetical protein
MSLTKPASVFVLLAASFVVLGMLDFALPLRSFAQDTRQKGTPLTKAQPPTYKTHLHCMSWGGGVPGLEKFLNDHSKKGIELVSFTRFPDFKRDDTPNTHCYLLIFKQ